MERLNDQELATVLAALRNFQQDIEKYGAETMTHAFPHLDGVEPLSPEAIDGLCERLNTAKHPDPEGLSMTLRDWRIWDDMAENVPEAMRGDYTVTLVRGSYDNLVLKMTTPSGDQSLLHIEAEQDHFKLIAYCPDKKQPTVAHDDCDAICRVTREGLIVYGNTGYSPALVLHGDHFSQVAPRTLQQLIGVLDGSTPGDTGQVINL